MESIKETYVTFAQAQALKRLGFDWECDHYYALGVYDWHLLPIVGGRAANFNQDKGECPIDCSAPALHIAAKWLREVKKLHVLSNACCFYKQDEGLVFEFDVQDLEDAHRGSCVRDLSRYETYEAALSEGITAAINYLNENQKEN